MTKSFYQIQQERIKLGKLCKIMTGNYEGKTFDCTCATKQDCPIAKLTQREQDRLFNHQVIRKQREENTKEYNCILANNAFRENLPSAN